MFYNLPVSQTKELEFLYSRYLGDKTDGVFVEIGANDGEYVSNTAPLADIGWTGYYVEPIPEIANLCRERHKDNKVRVDTLAIGNDGEVVTLWRSWGNGALTTSNEDMRDVWFDAFLSGESFQVTTVTLDAYLRQVGIEPDFDILVVDTEGMEYVVLSNCDLSYWKPKMLIVELCVDNECVGDLESVKECQFNTEQMLKDLYTEVYKDTINSVFVRKDIA